MFHLAAGKNFLHYTIPKPQKINFFSLEMGDIELKHLLSTTYATKMIEIFTPEEIILVNQNLKLLPFGESLPLNTQQGQDVFIEYMERDRPDGVFVDSVGSAVLGSINDGSNVQNLTNFNDKVRKRYNCFLWYIHHMRKQSQGNKSYGSGDDVYGDVYLTNRATSVYTMSNAKDGLIRVRNTKQRHSIKEDPYLLERVLNGSFEYKGSETHVPDALENIKQKITGGSKLSPEHDESPKLL